MVEYLIEVFEWVNCNGLNYYHLTNAKTFKSNKNIKDKSYYKNNKQFVVSKININET